MKRKDTIVIYPSPGMGHIVAMIELGKLIHKHNPSFSIKILIITPPFNTGATTSYINRLSSTTPTITFHHLPILSLPLDNLDSNHHENLTFELIQINNENLKKALKSLSQTSNILSIILDFFCAAALEVTDHLNIPSHLFFTSGAGALALTFYFPTIYNNTTKSLKDLNTHFEIPGLPPIWSTDMPSLLLDRNDNACKGVVYLANILIKAKGIIVNSFESLEPEAINAVNQGLCVPNAPTPSIYFLGPLIASDQTSHECLSWLDAQPSRSVVFLCFGTYGFFSSTQLREIAIGLERSGKRFLWVVRNPPEEDKSRRYLAPADPDLDELLPEGFLERTKERGLVVKTWAPQVEVLSRESVGGFVTHCGWNSILESVCAGVPIVAWPLYAEQRMNRVLLMEQMKLALSINESEDGFVSSVEVEERVKMVLESEEGRKLRDRTMVAREKARAALSEGGSSRAALANLVQSWKRC